MKRRLLMPLAFAVLLLLPSCFTFGLWGFELDSERDSQSGRVENSMSYDSETEWSWELLAFRLLLTPVALGLDCLTAPLQVWLWGEGDDNAPGSNEPRRSNRRSEPPGSLRQRSPGN